MRASITFDLAFVVNLDNDEVRCAMREHADAEGDATHAAVIEARERVHSFLHTRGDRADALRLMFDVEEVNVREAHVDDVCEACNKPGGGEYTSSCGVTLCAGCVERALSVILVREVLDEIGAYDIEVARALKVLEDDDNAARATSMQHVDAHASAWDMMRGDNIASVRERIDVVAELVVSATREPGTYTPRT